MLAHRQIADPDVAQALVHVGEQQIEQLLSERAARRAREPQPPHHEGHVQADHLEAPVRRVGHAQIPVEQRRSRLLYQIAIHSLGDLAPGAVGGIRAETAGASGARARGAAAIACSVASC